MPDLATSYLDPSTFASVASLVLRHRLIPNFNAEADGIRSDDLIDKLLATIAPAGNGASREMETVVR